MGEESLTSMTSAAGREKHEAEDGGGKGGGGKGSGGDGGKGKGGKGGGGEGGGGEKKGVKKVAKSILPRTTAMKEVGFPGGGYVF